MLPTSPRAVNKRESMISIKYVSKVSKRSLQYVYFLYILIILITNNQHNIIAHTLLLHLYNFFFIFVFNILNFINNINIVFNQVEKYLITQVQFSINKVTV